MADAPRQSDHKLLSQKFLASNSRPPAPVFLRFRHRKDDFRKENCSFGLDEGKFFSFTKVVVFPQRLKVSVEIGAESILVDREVKLFMPVAVFFDVFLTDFKL